MKKQRELIKIPATQQTYYWECGDGCCSNWGEEFTVANKPISILYQSLEEDILWAILNIWKYAYPQLIFEGVVSVEKEEKLITQQYIQHNSFYGDEDFLRAKNLIEIILVANATNYAESVRIVINEKYLLGVIKETDSYYLDPLTILNTLLQDTELILDVEELEHEHHSWSEDWEHDYSF